MAASIRYITIAAAMGIWPSPAQVASPTTTKMPAPHRQLLQPNDERTSVLLTTLLLHRGSPRSRALH